MKCLGQNFARVISSIDHSRGFPENIRQHNIHHIQLFLTEHLTQKRPELLSQPVQLLAAHRADLRDSELVIVRVKYLEVLVKDLLRRLIAEIAPRAEHIPGVLLNLHLRDLCELFRHLLIERRAGRRPEHQRVRDDG